MMRPSPDDPFIVELLKHLVGGVLQLFTDEIYLHVTWHFRADRPETVTAKIPHTVIAAVKATDAIAHVASEVALQMVMKKIEIEKEIGSKPLSWDGRLADLQCKVDRAKGELKAGGDVTELEFFKGFIRSLADNSNELPPALVVCLVETAMNYRRQELRQQAESN